MLISEFQWRNSLAAGKPGNREPKMKNERPDNSSFSVLGSPVPRFAWLSIWLSVWLLALSVGVQTSFSAQADQANPTASEKSPSATDADDKPGGTKITPDKFPEVDNLTRLTIQTLVVCVLGVIGLLALIVVGARRIRRMTRSPLLKSKYDELELLREKYRREVEGLDTPPPPSRESRR